MLRYTSHRSSCRRGFDGGDGAFMTRPPSPVPPRALILVPVFCAAFQLHPRNPSAGAIGGFHTVCTRRGGRSRSYWCVCREKSNLCGKGSLRPNGRRPVFWGEQPAFMPPWMAAQAPGVGEGAPTSVEGTTTPANTSSSRRAS